MPVPVPTTYPGLMTTYVPVTAEPQPIATNFPLTASAPIMAPGLMLPNTTNVASTVIPVIDLDTDDEVEAEGPTTTTTETTPDRICVGKCPCCWSDRRKIDNVKLQMNHHESQPNELQKCGKKKLITELKELQECTPLVIQQKAEEEQYKEELYTREQNNSCEVVDDVPPCPWDKPIYNTYNYKHKTNEDSSMQVETPTTSVQYTKPNMDCTPIEERNLKRVRENSSNNKPPLNAQKRARVESRSLKVLDESGNQFDDPSTSITSDPHTSRSSSPVKVLLIDLVQTIVNASKIRPNDWIEDNNHFSTKLRGSNYYFSIRPHTLEFLQVLRAKGFLIGILTTNSKRVCRLQTPSINFD